jgi:hypothetical protein
MGFWKKREERIAAIEAAQKAEAQRKKEEGDANERRIWEALEEAVAAHERGDLRMEAEALQRGVVGYRRSGFAGTAIHHTFRERLIELFNEGRLCQSKHLGQIAEFHLWKDRIIAADGSVYLIDEHVRASVEMAGNVTVTTHPTLARMAAGSLLPGSALIPGLAFQKQEVHD